MPSATKKLYRRTENAQDASSLFEGDIEALAFLVMMEAAKSARDDLKAIMDGVKAINKQKEELRKLMFQTAVNLLEKDQPKLTGDQKKVLITYVLKPC